MANDAANATGKQRGRPFPKGVSGNPRGRSAGSRNRATDMLDKIAAGEAEEILRATITAAKAGDVSAMRVLLERVWPPSRGRPVRFPLPTVETPADVSRALGSVLAAVSAGKLSPEDGAAVAGVVDQLRRGIELTEIEARIARLEAKKP